MIFAVLMNVVGYWFSDKIALRASRAKPASEQEAPQLYKILRDLTERADLPMPRVYTIPSDQPNAFATGRNAKHAAVAVTDGLMKYLPEDQIRGVLAHELAHVKNRDILVTSIAAMIAGAIAAIANILQFSFLFGGSGTTRTARSVSSARWRRSSSRRSPRRCSSSRSRASGSSWRTRQVPGSWAPESRSPMRSRHSRRASRPCR